MLASARERPGDNAGGTMWFVGGSLCRHVVCGVHGWMALLGRWGLYVSNVTSGSVKKKPEEDADSFMF